MFQWLGLCTSSAGVMGLVPDQGTKMLHACMKFGSVSCSDMSDSLQPHGLHVAHQAPLSMEFSREEY